MSLKLLTQRLIVGRTRRGELNTRAWRIPMAVPLNMSSCPLGETLVPLVAVCQGFIVT
jgi:hypothetical protein